MVHSRDEEDYGGEPRTIQIHQKGVTIFLDGDMVALVR